MGTVYKSDEWLETVLNKVIHERFFKEVDKDNQFKGKVYDRRCNYKIYQSSHTKVNTLFDENDAVSGIIDEDGIPYVSFEVENTIHLYPVEFDDDICQSCFNLWYGKPKLGACKKRMTRQELYGKSCDCFVILQRMFKNVSKLGTLFCQS